MFNARQTKALEKAPNPKARAAMKENFLRQKRAAMGVPSPAPSTGRKPAPKAQPKPPCRQKRGGGNSLPFSLDPLHPVPFPTSVSAGKALPITSLVEKDFTVHTRPRLLIVSNLGNCGSVAALLDINPTNGDGVLESMEILTFPTLQNADAAGGPTAGRAMKFSVAVANVTPSLKRGGRVTYLNSSQRIPGPAGTSATWANLNQLTDAIRTYPSRRRINGDVLGVAKQLVGFVCDHPSYTGYGPWRGTLTDGEFAAHVFGASAANPIPDVAVQHQRPMSVVVWLFDPTEDAQNYSVTIRGSYYTRWPLTTVPGQTMSLTPTAPQHILNHQHDAAEAAANELTPVGVASGLQDFGRRFAASAGEGLVEAAAPAARDMMLRGLEAL